MTTNSYPLDDPTITDPKPDERKVESAYVLRVIGAKDLLRASYDKLPNTYVEVRVGQLSMRTDIVKRSQDPSWNHEFHLLSNDPSSSKVLIRVMHWTLNPFLPDSCLGHVGDNLQSLITKCNESQGKISLNLLNPKKPYSYNEKRGLVELSLAEETATTVGSFAIAEAQRAVESGRVTAANGTLGQPIVSNADGLTPPAIAIASVISKLATLDKIVGKVSKVHPYVSVAWTVTSSLYKVVQGQLDRDKSIVDLLTAMEDVYSFVEVLESFPDKIKVLEDTIIKIAIQTVECAIFIREYSGHGFGDRIWRQTLSSTSTTIAQLSKTLTDLKASLDTGLAVQTAFHSFRTSEVVDALWQFQSLEQLKPTAMDASTRVECLPFTRQDILQSIIDWVLNPSPDQNILWLFGVTGSGKSAISTTIANYFRELGRLGAFLFFDRDVTERSDPSTVIRTLAYQLGTFDDGFTRAISNAKSSLSWQWPLQIQVEKLLVKPLSTVKGVAEQGPVVIILDALDECGSAKTRKPLLELFSTGLVKLLPNFRIIITSRAERDIQESFSSSSNILARELDLTTASNTNDIVAYFRHWMSIIRTSNHLLPLAPDWPGEDTIVSLAERSSGLFVWASTVVAFIEDGHDPEERLAAILGSETRAKGEHALDELYITALRSIGKWKDEAFRSDFRAIMGVILAARDPVLPSTIDKLIKPTRPSLHTISHLGCVLHWGHKLPLRVLHPSFAEFLTNRERCGNDEWFIDLAFHHRQLAHHCLKCLAEELHENVLGKKLDCRRRPNKSLLPKNIAYASSFWIEHVCMVSDDVSVLIEEVRKFLKLHLLHWLEAMSIILRTTRVNSLLEKLHGWLKLHLADDDPLHAFVEEALQFMQAFSAVIDQHPLAVYQTALPFTPKHSLLYNHFHDGNSYPVVTGSFDSLWPTPFVKLLLGHTGAVNSVAFSPDSSRIVSGSDDMTVRVWDVNSHTEIFSPLRGHDGSVLSVAYASDGKKFASSSADNTIRVWDAFTGRCLHVLRGHSGTVESIAFSPDATKIVSGSSDTTVRIWDIESELSLLTLSGHTDTVHSVAYCPNAAQVVSGSEDETARIWELDSGSFASLTGHSDPVLSVGVGSDGKKILCGTEHKTVIWDAGSRTILQFLYHQCDSVSIAFSLDGTLVFATCHENTVRIWNAVSTAELAGPNIRYHTDLITALNLSPSGALFACGSMDKSISVWDFKSFIAPPAESPNLKLAVSEVALSADSSRVVAGSEDGTLQVWDAHTFEPIATLQNSSMSRISSVAFFPDGTRLISGSTNGVLSVWDITTGMPVFIMQEHDERIDAVTVSPDGKRIASGSYTAVHIREADSGELVISPKAKKTRGLRFSPDSTILVSWETFNITMWDAQLGHSISERFMTSNMHVSSFVISSSSISTDDKKPGEWRVCDPLYVYNGGYNRGHIFHAESKKAITIIPPRMDVCWIPFSGSSTAAAFGRGRNVVVMHFPPSGLEKWTGVQEQPASLMQ